METDSSQQESTEADDDLLNSPIARAETKLAQVQSDEGVKEQVDELSEEGKKLIEERFGPQDT